MQAGKQVRLPAQAARERAEVLVILAGLLLALQSQGNSEGMNAAARKRVELLAMKAVLGAEKLWAACPGTSVPSAAWAATSNRSTPLATCSSLR
jgi:hypothetical protein